MPRDDVTSGFPEVDRLLARLPNTMAEELQRLLVKQMIAAKREVANRSNMSPGGKRAIRARDGIVRISPRKRVKPKRLSRVRAEMYSNWQGDTSRTAGRSFKALEDGIARQIEEEVGEREYRPRHARGLLIPTGDMLTAGGRPRRRGKRKIDIAGLPNTRVVTIRRGGRPRLLIVQELAAGKRAGLEGGVKGIRGTKLGQRERVVGVIVPKAKIKARIDFFGAWRSLRGHRTGQYSKMLERVARKSRR